MSPRQCRWCGAEFAPEAGNQRYCKPECWTQSDRARDRARKARRAPRKDGKERYAPLDDKVCPICEIAFAPKVPTQVTCGSNDCRRQRIINNNKARRVRIRRAPQSERELRAKIRRRDHHLRHNYSFSLEAMDELFSLQGGACAACGGDEPGANGWHLDHDRRCCPGNRSCGQCIRGVLCGDCNKAEGFIAKVAARTDREFREVAMRLAAYADWVRTIEDQVSMKGLR